jgi:DNA-binding transcriptional LysR family regulator
MRVFVRVAQLSGFAAAARDLGMSTAAVTKHIAALESRVGARLLDRTTRSVAITDAGRVYFERCLECIQSFADADAAVSELTAAPRGVLRVAAPVEFGQTSLAAFIATFMQAQPDLTLRLRLSNRDLSLVDEGIDVAIRIAESLEGGYVARPLATTRMVICGSPAYLRKHGRPRKPEDLAGHRMLVFVEENPLDELVFQRNGVSKRVPVRAAVVSNSGEALRVAACEGVGLAVLLSFAVIDDWSAGRLEPVLSDWSLPQFRISAIYPHRRFVSANVRAFVDALRGEYGDPTDDPWWTKLAARPSARRRR